MKDLFESTYRRIVEELESRQTVALVGGAFKPPTIGHFDMVRKYLNRADKVIVLISDPKSEKSERRTKSGKVITAEMSKKIWDMIVRRYGLGDRVEVVVSPFPSPITAAYDYVDKTLKDANVIFGVSKKGDDYKRYLGAQKYFEDRDDITILDPKENAVDPFELNGEPVSATTVRQNIDNPKMVRKYFPEKLTDGDISTIMEILA